MFAGRYELVDLLGTGGMGAVWRVWDSRERTYLAAKVLGQADASALLRFVREQSFRVDHPHVLAPRGWAGEDGRVLFTMDLVCGGSVATLVGDYGPMPVPWVATLLDQLLSGLDAVHGAGLVHRDVTPANLLLAPTGTARPHLYLSDFGVAVDLAAPRLTTAMQVVGTRGYLAPEQLRGGDPDPRSDLYSCGMVAVELVLGQRPGAEAGVPEAARVAAGPLADVVAALTAPDPDDRYDSAAQARTALAATGALDLDDAGGVEVLEHCPPLPVGWGPRGPQRSPVRLGRREWLAVAGVLIAAGGLLLVAALVIALP